MDVTVTGLDEAAIEIENMVARLRNPKPAMEAIAVEVKTFIDERFESRTAPDGSPWTPVTLHTAKYRETDGQGLARSRFANAQARLVRYGAKASFADVHQMGDGRVPARPFAPREGGGGPTDAFVEQARGLIERWVKDGETGWR